MLMQHTNPGDSRSALSKKPAFVPPFIRNANTKANTVVKDSMRTPPAFAPPFKRHTSIVQESSSKPQEEEDNHHDVFVIPHVPPTKKTQDSTDEPVLVDRTSKNVTDNQSLSSAGCVSPGTEASNGDDTLSSSQGAVVQLFLREISLNF